MCLQKFGEIKGTVEWVKHLLCQQSENLIFSIENRKAAKTRWSTHISHSSRQHFTNIYQPKSKIWDWNPETLKISKSTNIENFTFLSTSHNLEIFAHQLKSIIMIRFRIFDENVIHKNENDFHVFPQFSPSSITRTSGGFAKIHVSLPFIHPWQDWNKYERLIRYLCVLVFRKDFFIHSPTTTWITEAYDF